MIAYKVVRMTKYGKLISGTDYGFVTEYKINEKIKPTEKTGPLAVFKTKEKAKKFINFIDITLQPKIFSCLIKESVEKCVYYITKNREGKKYCKYLPQSHLPTDTILCSEITLLEEVKI